MAPFGILDHLYAGARNRAGARFFAHGWGSEDAMADVRGRIHAGQPAAAIDVAWESDWTPYLGHVARDGYFETPFYQAHLPPASRLCHFRLVLPGLGHPWPIYVHMATTGEEGYSARAAHVARPLLRQGCGTLLLEHPFLGRRRPPQQPSTRLRHVSDLLLLGGAAVEEARSLLVWLRRQGYRHLGITGVSIGGHLAALAGALTPFELALVPCVAPHSAVPIFTEGLMRTACDWPALARADRDRACARRQMAACLAFTGIDQFPRPRHGGAVIALAATHDRFVPRHSTDVLVRHWPQAQFRWVRGGHVSSIVGRKGQYVTALSDAMAILANAVA